MINYELRTIMKRPTISLAALCALAILISAALAVPARAQSPATPMWVASVNPPFVAGWDSYHPQPTQPPFIPPTLGPTATPQGFYTVTALTSIPVFMCPSRACYILTTLPTGTVVTVRWAGPGWVQLESGYASGSYAENINLR
jgi:hypothetical protein